MLRSGQRMVRADDGMRGVVEPVAMPGFEQYTELRVVYYDRGERRVAGKREVWAEEDTPSRKLRSEEILNVASFADHFLRCIDRNEPLKWWEWGTDKRGPYHDPVLVDLIIDHLSKRA
jgi:hypothetical protein